jgi:protein ImuB
LLLEVGGSLRLFGGLECLIERLREGLDAMELTTQFAVAPAARAALWRSRGGGARLEELPLEVTGFDSGAFFRNIGISTVGELLKLPREGLARRCGQALLDDLDRALGTAPEAREFFTPPPRFAAKLGLPAEVSHAEGLLFAARRLLVQLEGLLAARHAGVRAFTVFLFHQKKAPTAIEIGLASPAREAGRLGQLLREKLATLSLSCLVEAIGLEAGDFSPLHARTAGMFGDALAEDESWERLAERLQARLGHGAVYGLATHPDHRPEYSWRRVEPGEWDPREFRHSGPRPLWLLQAPRPMREDDLQLLAGPERIECGWWDGDEARRDYFIARFSDSSLGWVYREAGAWFLHGLFA